LSGQPASELVSLSRPVSRWTPDAGCPTTDARIQNLKTLISMLFVQSALPDYSLNDGPDYPSKYPSKEILQ
jgi:hypothetical protein